MTGTTTPDLSEARRLLKGGMKLVRLRDGTKQPVGKNWHRSPVRHIDSKATGYGQILELNGLCSIDPDNWPLAVKALTAVGLNLEALMAEGVRTRSTRPGSGGRSVFKAPQGVKYFKFSCEGIGTVFELRMGERQDAIPGLVYRDRTTGETHTQHYANGKKLDEAEEVPSDLLAWWQLVSSDVDAKREQQRLMGEALGLCAHLSVSSGDGTLAFGSRCRGAYNRCNKVEDLLIQHGYVEDDEVTGRYSPPNATGAPGVWLIETKDDLWQSAHASDPLEGTFDAWSANVQLNFKGDLDAAEKHFQANQLAPDVFENFDLTDPLAAPATSRRFKLLTPEEVAARAPVQWIVRGVLPATGIAALYGRSATGKSFLAFDMGAAVAEGQRWYGRRVKAHPVVYVALEGEDGFRNRALAWVHHHGRPVPARFRMVLQPFKLTDAQDLKDLAAAILDAGGSGPLVFIDTLNRAAPGTDENSSKDMGEILNATKALQRLVGGLVVLIHHAGKDDNKGLRGHSSMFAAMDSVIKVERGVGEARSWSVEKSKDDQDGTSHPFKLEVVVLGEDEDGERVTSCVVVAAELSARPAKRLTSSQRNALDLFNQLAGDPPAGVALERWRFAFNAASTADNAAAKKTAFLRARNALVEMGHLTVANDVYYSAGGRDFADLDVFEGGPEHGTQVEH